MLPHRKIEVRIRVITHGTVLLLRIPNSARPSEEPNVETAGTLEAGYQTHPASLQAIRPPLTLRRISTMLSAYSEKLQENGMNVEPLRKILVALFLAGFVALYGYFLIAIIQAPSDTPPQLDDRLVGLAATMSGVLGTAFAVALGVKSQGGVRGAFALPSISLNTLLGVGLWAYAAVGVAALVTYILNLDETPGSISSLALVLVGYVAGAVTNAYKAVLPKNG